MKHTTPNTVTSNAFTGGEWEATQITKKQIIIGIKGYGEGNNYRKDNSCGQIAQIHGWDGNKSADLSSEDFANARLIAESKNMYLMLQQLLKDDGFSTDLGEGFAEGIKDILTRIENNH